MTSDAIAEKIEASSSSKESEDSDDPAKTLEGELVMNFNRKLSLDIDPQHYGHTSHFGLERDDEKSFNSANQIGAWTTVTSDVDFINHLFRLYFTWAHPFYVLFSEETFYHGLEHRRAKYCTPLLVNSVLALGCHFSERPEARADPNDPKSVGNHFFEEARRMLREDEDHPSLTIVQSLAVMSLHQAMNSSDSSGRRYAAQMMTMAVELGLHTSTATQPSSNLSATEIEARRITFWGCFILDIGWSIAAGKLSFLPRTAVSIDKPNISQALESKVWISDESDQLTQQSHKYGILVQNSLLCEVVDDILQMFYAPRDRVTSRRLILHHEKLQAWFKALPDYLAIHSNAPTLPQVVALQ